MNKKLLDWYLIYFYYLEYWSHIFFAILSLIQNAYLVSEAINAFRITISSSWLWFLCKLYIIVIKFFFQSSLNISSSSIIRMILYKQHIAFINHIYISNWYFNWYVNVLNRFFKISKIYLIAFCKNEYRKLNNSLIFLSLKLVINLLI